MSAKLVAYVSLSKDSAADAVVKQRMFDELRHWLPENMIPSTIMVVDMPLTVSGVSRIHQHKTQ